MKRPTNEPTLREYLSVLSRHKLTVLLIFVITTGAVAIHAFITPRTFKADTTLIVRFGREFIYKSEIAGLDSSKTFDLAEMVNSEVEILNSRDIARQVVEELGVETLYPDLVADDIPPATARTLATAIFQDHLTVSPVFDSSIIRVTFEHRDPGIAVEAIHLLVERFKDKHVEVFGDSKSSFLKSQLETCRSRLESVETSLHTFKRENRVYQISEQRTALLSQRAQLGSDLRNTCLLITEVEHKRRLLDDDNPVFVHLASDPVLSKQRAALLDRRQAVSSLVGDTDFRISEVTQKLRRFAERQGETALVPDAGTTRIRSIDEAFIRLLDLRLNERGLLRNHRDESRELVAVRAEIALVEEFLKERGKLVRETLQADASDELTSLEGLRATLSDQLSKIDSDLGALDSRERMLHAQTLTTELAILESKKRALAAELDRLAEELSAFDLHETELHRLERELLAAEQRYQTVLASFEEARTADELDERKIVNIGLIEKATLPVTPSGLSRKVQIAIGAVIGLVAGLAVAFLLELLND